MAFSRTVSRILPDGTTRTLHPFHISFKGLEKTVLCKDDEDYDAFVKQMFLCSLRKNVRVIIYVAVSNHGHIAILATDYQTAISYGEEVKRMYSMWYNHRYRKTGILIGADINVQYLDSDWYVRNALAYIPRNALDNGFNVTEYRWSGFQAMFSSRKHDYARSVSSLSKREREQIFHTNMVLRGVTWKIDREGRLIAETCCDCGYLESAFNNDSAFFLKTIGNVNSADMTQKLVDGPRNRQNDGDFLVTVDEICMRWFQVGHVSDLSLDRKIRLLPYVYRTKRTTISQLSRIFGMDREQIKRILER